MNVLVTGSSGYLGGWVVKELEAAGHKVSTSPHGGRRHYALRYDRPFSLTHPAQLKELVQWSHAVVHLAWYAVAGDSRDVHRWSCERADELFRETVDRGRYTRRVVFTSTLSVYGDWGETDTAEQDRVSPNCDYTRWKVAAEDSLRHWAGTTGSILRLGSLMGVGVPGGRTRTDLCVNAFAAAGWRGEAVEVWDPECYKPVLHVRDAARLVAEAVRGKLPGTTNCASQCLKARELADVVREETGAQVRMVEKGRGGTRSCTVGCEKLRTALPRITFRKVKEAVAEFEGYSATAGDRTETWS